jgi:hypothetical protein
MDLTWDPSMSPSLRVLPPPRKGNGWFLLLLLFSLFQTLFLPREKWEGNKFVTRVQKIGTHDPKNWFLLDLWKTSALRNKKDQPDSEIEAGKSERKRRWGEVEMEIGLLRNWWRRDPIVGEDGICGDAI